MPANGSHGTCATCHLSSLFCSKPSHGEPLSARQCSNDFKRHCKMGLRWVSLLQFRCGGASLQCIALHSGRLREEPAPASLVPRSRARAWPRLHARGAGLHRPSASDWGGCSLFEKNPNMSELRCRLPVPSSSLSSPVTRRIPRTP